ncbi:hypothetical protein FPSM_01776 [Flavobacterium psychrophilum]|nr:hypothetical protein FPSM_01776 [Flavobacterium psychrophilum]
MLSFFSSPKYFVARAKSNFKSLAFTDKTSNKIIMTA